MTTSAATVMRDAASRAVPVIDIAAYDGGSPSDRRALAQRIDEACRTVGFLTIVGHGVPDALVARTERAARAFFDLPVDTKLGYRSPDPAVYRGYFALESNAVAYSLDATDSAPDLFERFSVGRVALDRADPYFSATPTARAIFAANIWPREVADFEAALSAYYQAMEGLALTLMRLFALGLGLDERWFDDKVDRHMTAFVIQNYPDQATPPRPGQLRAGPHSDYGSLTILKTEDKPGGLEIRGADGTWQPVTAQPGSFIVNIGDLMAQWTNDRWVSTMHRVVNPPRDQAIGSRRQSLIFFHQPNYDAPVECLPSCLDGGAAKYAPTTSGEHLLMKLKKQTSV
jgi:isopenicillin N synthase-like dioxygenase